MSVGILLYRPTTKYEMRLLELFETALEPFTDDRIPRMWIGPKGEVVKIDEDNDEPLSHSQVIEQNPRAFGLENLAPARNQYSDHHTNRYFYDVVIALAEAKGWVRVSWDYGGSYDARAVAMSGASIPNLHRALIWLYRNNFAPTYVDLEVETLVNGQVNHAIRRELRGKEIDLFYRSGRLPVKRF